MTTDEINKIERLLGMIDERTKSIQHELCTAGKTLDSLAECTANHETRVIALENKAKENRELIKWMGSGVIIILSGVVIYVLRAIGFPIN